MHELWTMSYELRATSYKRVLLKISGEGFCSENGRGIEKEAVASVAREIGQALKQVQGAEIAVVVGGGRCPTQGNEGGRELLGRPLN